MERYFKVEGNIIYPNDHMLTWGPFYYHSYEKAKSRMNVILEDIINWVNLKDPSLNIKPENYIKCTDEKMVVFEIKAWQDEDHLENCNGIITVEDIFFEDEH